MTLQEAWAVARNQWDESEERCQEALGVLEQDGRNPNLIRRLRAWIGHITSP